MNSLLRGGVCFVIGTSGLVGCSSPHGSAALVSSASTPEPVRASPVYVSESPQVAPLTSRDVVVMSHLGTRDDLIISRIEQSQSVFHLTAAEVNHLRDNGVSESVIEAMRSTARR